MKKKLPTILLVLIFLAGLCLLLYPSVSNYWNSIHQSKEIEKYDDNVSSLRDEEYNRILSDAYDYNEMLYQKANRFKISKSEKKRYNETLNLGGYGIMGYVEIPTIKCTLPIYHSTDENVLQIAAGHIEGTSLPVGGVNTHCVLSGHRGLVSAKLLSDLDKMAEGDIFMLHVLDRTLTYKVDQIRIVEPREVSDIEIVDGEDYCTLVTCTPYGINTHRLLVRGRRIENREFSDEMRVSAEAKQIDPIYVAPFVALPIIIGLSAYLLFKQRRRKQRGRKYEK